MSTIGSTTQLLAQIRAHAVAFRRQHPPAGPAARAGRAASKAAGAAPDWTEQVARAVVAIAPDDPQRRRRAFRIYLQAVLSRECGIVEVETAAFQDLVERVQHAIEAAPQLRRAVERAGELLLESAAR